MIRLIKLLKEAEGDAKSTSSKLLFVGDAETRVAQSYANQILHETGADGRIIAWKGMTTAQILRVIKRADLKNYGVITIMAPNSEPGKSKIAIRNLAEAFKVAKESGARVIAISNTSKSYLRPTDSSYKPEGDIDNEQLGTWVNNQTITDAVIDVNSLNQQYLRNDRMRLNLDGQKYIAEKWKSIAKSMNIKFTDTKSKQVEPANAIQTAVASTPINTSGKYETSPSDSVADQATAIIKQEESGGRPRLQPKWDVNNWRIGYGSSTVTQPNGKVIQLSNDKNAIPNITITPEDADRDLKRRIETEFIPKVKSSIGSAADKLNNSTLAALTSVCYNYGSLPSSVVIAAKTGDITKIADAVLSLADQSPIHTNRRTRESKWILNSETKETYTGKNGKLSASELKPISGGHKLSPKAADAFLKMEKAANKEGIKFNVTDSYRPYEIQDKYFDWERYKSTGERKKRGTNVAMAIPGTSNHGWGNAIDVGPAEAQDWIKRNGEKYGWSWDEGRSVGEPWHFTYVG